MKVSFTSSLTGLSAEVEGPTGVLSKARVAELRELASLLSQTANEDAPTVPRINPPDPWEEDEDTTVHGMDIAALVIWAIERGI